MTGNTHLPPPGGGRETARSAGPGEGSSSSYEEDARSRARPSPQPSPRRGEGAVRAKAKAMRAAMTVPEAVVWKMLRPNRLNGWKFARQVPVGPYIVDFAARRERLAIEIDGRSHDLTVEHDVRRETYLKDAGYTVLRFTNAEVAANLDGIARSIDAELRGGTLSPKAS